MARAVRAPHSTQLAGCKREGLLAAPCCLQAKSYGPIMSGALFGAGWWFWVDAVTCNNHKVPFDQVLSRGGLHAWRVAHSMQQGPGV